MIHKSKSIRLAFCIFVCIKLNIMLVKTYASALKGIEALIVTVEVNIFQGIKFVIVGLPDSSVKESQERIDSALRVYGYKIPGRHIIVNMAPADIKKEGAAYDLPIAIGILAANEDIPTDNLGNYLMMGELSLDGSLLPIRGVLPICISALESGFKGVIVPKDNIQEASVIEGLDVYGMNNLKEVIEFLSGSREFTPVPTLDFNNYKEDSILDYDFADVKGQENVKRALEIAAAGGHNAIMIGPPGSGKTMLAKRLPGIMPPLSMNESLETSKIHSIVGNMNKGVGLIKQRPFRAPHHTISDTALIGGGAYPRPGEISLAHNGVLFLDELPEFKRSALEVMRQPLEDGEICIARAKMVLTYPSNIMLIASMNPCPCGYYNHPDKECVCPPGAVKKYLSKISGPLLDRIDLHIEVVPLSFNEISSEMKSETSSEVRKRVINARNIQSQRFRGIEGIYSNSQMTSSMMHKYCKIDNASKKILEQAMEKTGLSARAYNRILKVARTIADLSGEKDIKFEHISEAIQYRSLDRDSWGN